MANTTIYPYGQNGSLPGEDIIELDPIFTESPAYGITSADITNWNSKTSNTGTVTQVKIGTTAYNPSSGIVSLPAYPSTAVDVGAQPTLVSGTNIKTINNQSLLGSGNISISGGTGTGAKVYAFDYTSWDYDVVSGHLSIPLATYEEMVSDAQNGIPVILRLQNYTTSGGVITDANVCDFYLGLYQQYGSVESSCLHFYQINDFSGIFINHIILYRSANTVVIDSFNERMLQLTNQKVNSITGAGNTYQYPSTQAVVNYVAANGGLPAVTSADYGRVLFVNYDQTNGYHWSKDAPMWFDSGNLNLGAYYGIVTADTSWHETTMNFEGVSHYYNTDSPDWRWLQYDYYDSNLNTVIHTTLQDTLDNKQNLLVSGTNIKTINNNSLVGSGNVSVGTVTGITMNGASKGTSGVVDLGTVLTSETALSKGTTTGTGNAVTDISVSGHQITLTKGSTFLTSETSLSKGTTTGSGNAVTDVSVNGHQITLTKGTTFLTSHQDISGKANLSGAAFTGAVTGTSSGNNAQFRNITVSSSEPTSSQGSNGDIWIVI